MHGLRGRRPTSSSDMKDSLVSQGHCVSALVSSDSDFKFFQASILHRKVMFYKDLPLHVVIHVHLTFVAAQW